MNHNMEWQTAPLVSLAYDAVDCILEDNDESLIARSMCSIPFARCVVTKVTDAFLHAEPNL
jgi:hypothetical protein